MVCTKWAILDPKMVYPYNSGTFCEFCKMKGPNRYMKNLLFFEKKNHLGQFDLFSL